MKKLLPRHLFCKIGLLISSCVIDLSQMKINADETPPTLSSLWPSTPQSDLHSLLSDGDVFTRMDSSPYSSSQMTAGSNSKPATSWRCEKTKITFPQILEQARRRYFLLMDDVSQLKKPHPFRSKLKPLNGKSYL